MVLQVSEGDKPENILKMINIDAIVDQAVEKGMIELENEIAECAGYDENEYDEDGDYGKDCHEEDEEEMYVQKEVFEIFLTDNEADALRKALRRTGGVDLVKCGVGMWRTTKIGNLITTLNNLADKFWNKDGEPKDWGLNDFDKKEIRNVYRRFGGILKDVPLSPTLVGLVG